MNQEGIQLAEQLARREYSAIEYRNRLVRMQNMDLICHCSAEIDMGTLLYFSVNNLYMGHGSYVVLLFSEISDVSSGQNEGRDVFSRMFTYAIVEQVANELFTGHYSFFSSELDGRLVFILSFPFGLLPDPSIVDYLDTNCVEISERCRELYGMNLITYISEPIDNIRHISAVYTKLLETATLHRYIDHHFDSPAFRVSLPKPAKWGLRRSDVQESARRLVLAILNGDDYHTMAEQTLRRLSEEEPSGIDNLKRIYGDYFELICRFAAQMGIKLSLDELREEQFRVLFASVRSDEFTAWMHHFLDILSEEYNKSSQKAVRRQYDEALDYIDRHLGDVGLSMDSCADAVGCSTSALSKLFRRNRNISVAKYIRERRLELALSLLKEDCSVGETCERCGFGSTETFHRAFKARYGVTPGQFRTARPSEQSV